MLAGPGGLIHIRLTVVRVAYAGLSTFTRIFLPFSSLSQARADERSAALLAETRKTFHRSN